MCVSRLVFFEERNCSVIDTDLYLVLRDTVVVVIEVSRPREDTSGCGSCFVRLFAPPGGFVLHTWLHPQGLMPVILSACEGLSGWSQSLRRSHSSYYSQPLQSLQMSFFVSLLLSKAGNSGWWKQPLPLTALCWGAGMKPMGGKKNLIHQARSASQ